MVPESDLEQGALRMLEVDNRLILPELTHIRFIVTAADVIHSFACPSLGIKCDAYPGRLNQVSVMMNRAGTFFGQCSEICGILHSSMPIVIESISVDKFVSWLTIGIVPIFKTKVIKQKIGNKCINIKKSGIMIPMPSITDVIVTGAMALFLYGIVYYYSEDPNAGNIQTLDGVGQVTQYFDRQHGNVARYYNQLPRDVREGDAPQLIPQHRLDNGYLESLREFAENLRRTNIRNRQNITSA